ncbi:hypothetical protein J2Z82_002732 [Virgibacillus litoralis]|uniref:Uncharacterized protein n=1 Tax=Virgibacillus litoralis TaxID=578221 RepID=A0ABS4HFS9_9BACI|nr:hypothetical protein [Virgibacillus litoralis]
MNRKQLAWIHHIHATVLLLLLLTGHRLLFIFFQDTI